MNGGTTANRMSDGFEFQDEIDWPDGDIRETLKRRPEANWQLPVEVTVCPRKTEKQLREDKAAKPIYLYGTLTRVQPAPSGDAYYYVSVRDPKNPENGTKSRMVRCMSSKITVLKLRIGMREDVVTAWYQSALQAAIKSSASRTARDQKHDQKIEVIRKAIGDNREAQDIFNSLGLKKHPSNSTALDPSRSFDLMFDVTYAYLQGLPLTKASSSGNDDQNSAFLQVARKRGVEARTVERIYYQWIWALHSIDQ